MKAITLMSKRELKEYKSKQEQQISELRDKNMGINLVSVEAISWQKQDDGQLTNLSIHFLPEND